MPAEHLEHFRSPYRIAWQTSVFLLSAVISVGCGEKGSRDGSADPTMVKQRFPFAPADHSSSTTLLLSTCIGASSEEASSVASINVADSAWACNPPAPPISSAGDEFRSTESGAVISSS